MLDLADGAAIARRALAQAVRPPRKRSVSQWAEEEREVPPDSGSPEPGKWKNALTPYLVEPMDCTGPDDPCSEVAIIGSAQTGKSSVGENFTGHMISDDQGPMLIVLPSLDEGKKYNRVKLGPMIEATPALRCRVRDQKSRDTQGSTGSFKKLDGGQSIVVTGANSSSGLQMISCRRLLAEEISEYPDDLDGRGDPLLQAEARLKAWLLRGPKKVYLSTPGIKGSCRITTKFEAGDQRRYYLECPQCGVYFTPRFAHLKWRQEEPAYGAYLACPAHGCVIEHWQKRAMVARGVWLKTYPGEDAPGDFVEADDVARFRARPSRGRHPSFHFWQVISPFVDWEQIAKEYFDSRGNHLLEKVFAQQGLGEAFEEKGEAPDDEKLALVAQNHGHRLGAIPPGGLVLTGFVDVQANRLEWGVWAWADRALTSWLVDKGIVEGDPESDETWKVLEGTVLGRTYAMPAGRRYPVELWGVDTGFKSHAVYAFARGRPNVRATNGLAGHLLPLIGTPKKVDVNWKGKLIRGGVMLYGLGTFPLKSLLYAGLRKAIGGPDADGIWPQGCVHLSRDIDRDYCRQVTAEFLADEHTRDGRVRKVWKKKADQPNEALDIWVGARAMAEHLGLGRYTQDQWQDLAAERTAPPDQAQLELLEAAPQREATAAPPPRPEAPVETDKTAPGMASRTGWLNANRNWMRRH